MTTPAIPRGVWVLGFVSLFMDVSSELIHSLLPVFMISSLGASAFAVGIIEGIAESSRNHTTLLGAGLIVLVVADLVLAQAQGLAAVALGVAFWGLHLGMTQGLLATMVADTAPAHLPGTAFGFFNLACGLAMLIASALAGLLWVQLGAAVTFYAGAIFSAAALIMLVSRKAPSPAA